MEKEHFKIVKLSPEYLQDYLYFFEHVAHTDNPEWDRCYCLNYCTEDNLELAKNEFYDPDVRKEYAIKYIQENSIQGYLAFYNGKVVGWCNANDRKKCAKSFGKIFIYGEKEPVLDDQKVKAIYCFTVAPEFRRKQIATKMLMRVIEDATSDGYDYLEAYPEKGETDEYYNYPGHLVLYEKFGFVKSGQTDCRLVYRKQL